MNVGDNLLEITFAGRDQTIRPIWRVRASRLYGGLFSPRPRLFGRHGFSGERTSGGSISVKPKWGFLLTSVDIFTGALYHVG